MDNIWIIGIHTITDVKNLIPMLLQILDTSSRHQKKPPRLKGSEGRCEETRRVGGGVVEPWHHQL